MATNTSRTNLRRPQRGQVGDPNDPINVLLDWNQSLDIIDDGIGIPNYTSVTHSADPFDGKMEYEADTGLYAIWDATIPEWVTFPGESQSIGYIGEDTVTVDGANLTSVSGESGPYMRVTFNALSGRRYWIEDLFWVVPAAGTLPFAVVPRVRWAPGAVVTNVGTQLGSDYNLNMVHALNQEEHSHKIYEYVAGSSQQITVGLFLTVVGASKTARMRGSTIDFVNYMGIRDVGV